MLGKDLEDGAVNDVNDELRPALWEACPKFLRGNAQGIEASGKRLELAINRLKQWRGLATRYEKRAVNYRAMLVLAAIVMWLQP